MLGKQDEGANFYTQPLLGYRTWAINKDDLLLKGTIRPWVWPVTEDACAECLRGASYFGGGVMGASAHEPHRPNDVPVRACQCGFYAYNTYRALRQHHHAYPPKLNVRGVAIGWGKAWTAERGWRAKWARPVALLRWPERRSDLRQKFSAVDLEEAEYLEDIIAQIALRYNIPFVASQAELEDAGQAYLNLCR